VGQTGTTIPEHHQLAQNHPNPFNPGTTIEYGIPGVRGQSLGGSSVKLVVYDMLGREVAVLVDEMKEPGSYQVRFDASGLASGVYLYRMSAREPSSGSERSFVATKKLLILK
jgi:hypothetical protein